MMKNFTQLLSRLLMMLCFSLCAFVATAQRTISGEIKDGNGAALPGATILIKGTTTGTTSDANGKYSITVPSDNTVLVISSVGQGTREVKVGNSTALDIALSNNDEMLNAVVVTSSQKPVRKIETITAVDVIGAKELARATPINLVDAIRFTPGVFVTTGAGRTRNGVFVRGFPDLGSNGLIYTSLLFDGLRTFASPEMVPDAAFRMDMNIDKIEVVRGAAATLYGRGAAAGAINVISKTGGEKLGGGARVTYGQRGMIQTDINLNGPISQNFRYNVGGFYLKDDGLRDNAFPDKGFQMRGNVDYLLPENKGNIRFFAGAINLNVQNQIDLPYLATDLSKPAPGYTTRDVIVTKGAMDKHFNKEISLTYPDGDVEKFNIKDKMAKGNFSKGFHIGLNFDYDLGSGFSIINKGRFQDMVVGTQFDFPLTATYGANQNRVLFVGNGKGDGGSHAKDFINEFRVQKVIEGENATHNLTAGVYYSNINVRAVAIGHFYNVITANAAQRTDSIRGALGFGPAPLFLNSLFRNGTYKEKVSSFFAGDEMKFGNQFTVNAGIRKDYIDLDMKEDRYTDPSQRNANRAATHDGLSGSVGFNYMLNEKSALYGNYLLAYRAPDYSAYTTVQYGKYTRDAAGNVTGLTRLVGNDPIVTDEKGRPLYLNNYIDKNEIINSYEMGYRTSFGDLSFDGALFMNNIKDRLVSTFIGATAVQIPGGDNRIMGTEISLYYAPQILRGFYARANVTLQKTEYTKLQQSISFTSKLDVSGNKVAGIPTSIWNLSLGYERSNFGINFNSNLLGGRPVDPFNTIYYQAMPIADANVFYRLAVKNTSGVKLKASVTNLFDNQGAGNVVSGSTDNFYKQAKDANYTGNFTHVRGVPQLPRRVYLSLEYMF
jgi:outer membrane receptor protein involved in Fe transport